MDERTRPSHRGDGPAPGGLGNPFAADAGGNAYVTSGPYAEQLPVGGMTVRQIRRRYGDRFDLDPNAVAVLDGHQADEDTTIRPGQMLMFVRRAGEKGVDAAAAGASTADVARGVPAQRIRIEGDRVLAVSPEGLEASLPVDQFVERLAPRRLDTGPVILPDGVKSIIAGRGASIWVHETPPRVYNLKWIRADSPADYGKETTYRSVRIALPYVIVLAVFETPPGEPPRLSGVNECFFRTAPLRSLDDGLLYPALLNCSRFDPPEDKPLAWICTQFLKRPADRLREMADPTADPNDRIRQGLRDLMTCLFETGFNRSSEHHETNSWFSESRGRDARIATIEAWEQATTDDPNFVLDVPWIEVGKSVGEVARRIFGHLRGTEPQPSTASDLARLVFNQRRRTRRPDMPKTLFEEFLS